MAKPIPGKYHWFHIPRDDKKAQEIARKAVLGFLENAKITSVQSAPEVSFAFGKLHFDGVEKITVEIMK